MIDSVSVSSGQILVRFDKPLEDSPINLHDINSLRVVDPINGPIARVGS